MDRTRTVTWLDSALGVEAGTRLSGLEYLRAMARGEAPSPPPSGKFYARATGTFVITGPEERRGR